MAKREDAPAGAAKTASDNGKEKPEVQRVRVNPQAVITVKVEGNPKRQGTQSYDRFKLYTNGMTIEQALKAGVTTADIRHDAGKGFIALSGLATQ